LGALAGVDGAAVTAGEKAGGLGNGDAEIVVGRAVDLQRRVVDVRGDVYGGVGGVVLEGDVERAIGRRGRGGVEVEAGGGLRR